MSPNNLHEETPDWLIETQNRSWEPEILISGLTLTSLFIFPAELFNFFAKLIQEYGLDYVTADTLFTYLSMVLNAFKITFIVHLVFRFLWAAMVGLSFVFPKGVINEKLPKRMQGNRYTLPVNFVIRLEKISSLLFSIPMGTSIVLLLMTVFLMLIAFIAIQFDLGFEAFFLAVLMVSILSILFGYALKNSKIGKVVNTSLPSTVGAIYMSNFGKWPAYSVILSSIILSFPFILQDKQNFSYFDNTRNISESQRQWPDKEVWYEKDRHENKRFAKALLPSYQVQKSQIPLSIAYFDEDQRLLEKFSAPKTPLPDSLGWKAVKGNSDEELYRIYLNDTLIDPLNFSSFRATETGQKFYQVYLDIGPLPLGEHVIRIEKIHHVSIFGFINKYKIRENWALLRFRKANPY